MLPKSSEDTVDAGSAAPLQPPPTRSFWSIAAAAVRAAFAFAPAEQNAVEIDAADREEETGNAVDELQSDAVLIDGEAHEAQGAAVLENAVDSSVNEDEAINNAAEQERSGEVVAGDSVLSSGDGLDGAPLSDAVANEVADDAALHDAVLSDADVVLSRAAGANVCSTVGVDQVMNSGTEEKQSGAALNGTAKDAAADEALSDAVLSDLELIDLTEDYRDDAKDYKGSDDEYGDAACEAIGGGEEEERTDDSVNANDCEQENATVRETTNGGGIEEQAMAATDAVGLAYGDAQDEDEYEELSDSGGEEADDDNDEDYEFEDAEDDDDNDDEDAVSVMSIDSDREDDKVDQHKLLKRETRLKDETQTRRIKRKHNTVRSHSTQDFRCDVATCGVSFTKKENLVRHIAGYHEVKPGREYRCDPCDLQFATRHEKELHGREVNHKRFPCTLPDCGKSYSKREHLNRHVLTAHNKHENQEKPFRCELCDIGFAYAHGLVRHQNRSHVNQNKPYECAQCLLAFKKKSDLQAHSYVHTGVLPFECDDCSARFAKRFQLVRHERTHAGKKKPQAQVFFCEEDGCSEMLLSAGEKCAHDKEAHNKETFSEPAEMAEIKQEEKLSGSAKKHNKKRRRRSESVVADVKPSLDRTEDADPAANRRQLLVCQVCERTFQRKQYLRAHLRTHFEELDERKMHVCPMDGCANAYTRRSNLMAHYNAVHDAVRSQRFVCPFEGCEGKFGYKKVLTTHIDSVHLNPTPVKKRRVGVKATSARARVLGLDQEDSTSSMMVVVDGLEERACS